MSNMHDADPSIRLEILTKIRDGAGNHYFRAWSENLRAMDITREWLRAAYAANGNSPLIETIMPLLHVRGQNIYPILREAKGPTMLAGSFQIIDRLPLTVETLKASKLGKLVVKLVKDPPSPGELMPPFTRLFSFILLGQNVSGYTAAPVERKIRSRFSHQRYTYVLQPFCLDIGKNNRIKCI